MERNGFAKVMEWSEDSRVLVGYTDSSLKG